MEDSGKAKSGGGRFSCISGAQHVIINKKTLFQAVLLVAAGFAGTLVAENMVRPAETPIISHY